ncbi:MAG TPA: glycosyltransferase family 9 protein [Geothrix sp.]|nr:glycosyltransferase family 9 protein [Geothrix sp.]
MAVIPEQATWVRFPRYIGDAVMQMSVLRLLRLVDPAPLVVWGPGLTVALVEGTGLADAVCRDRGKPSPWELADTLKRHRAARSVHFPKSLRPALGAFLARVPERIGVSESLAGLFNTHSLPFWKGEGHCLDRYHKVLRLRWPGAPAMPMADYTSPFQAELPDHPYVCLMPGASTAAKAWEPEHFRETARLLSARGLLPVVLGGPAERELGAFVAGDHGLNRCGDTLVEAAAWMQGASGAVGNDSGLSHLAAACGTPVLVLYGPMDPGMFTPFGPAVRTVQRDPLPCMPCGKDHCRVAGHPCLRDLTPGRICAELEPLLR